MRAVERKSGPMTASVEPPAAPRSDRTRQRLIEAGLELFGSAGLDGVSTRQLAEAARANQAAIPYHFGGKGGVYLAVAEHIAATTGARIREAAEASVASLKQLTPRQAGERAGRLLADVVQIVLRAPDAAQRGGLILREQLQPTAAFDVLHDGFVVRVHEALGTLAGRAIGARASAPGTVFVAHALLGQALVFGMARETLLRRLGGKALGPADLECIHKTVQALAAAALAGFQQEMKNEP